MATTSEHTRIWNEKLRPVIERLAKDGNFVHSIRIQADPGKWLELFQLAQKTEQLDDPSAADGRPVPTFDDIAQIIKMMNAYAEFMDGNGFTDLLQRFQLNAEQV